MSLRVSGQSPTADGGDALRLVIGNKNYSSWSLRAWLALRAAGAAFDEELVPLDQPGTREQLQARSPSGRVPVLVHGALVVHESLAICEYVAELFPAAGLWPTDRAARAVARAVSAEMHAGFADLRAAMPMDIRGEYAGTGHTPGALRDAERVMRIWRECRDRFGGEQRFLFGAFSIADAMFAPVVTRFRSYGVELGAVEQSYADAVWAHPPMQEWIEAARREPWVLG